MHSPGKHGHDPLPEIVEIVRDAIKDGLVNEPLATFNENIRTLHGAELEDYIQNVWDQI